MNNVTDFNNHLHVLVVFGSNFVEVDQCLLLHSNIANLHSDSFFTWQWSFAKTTSKSLCIRSFPLYVRSVQRRARSEHSSAVERIAGRTPESEGSSSAPTRPE
ncbi:hypothetical protein Ahy_B10g100949 isoform D [Arachis hypogaea]|uniref:Uncharacterized protein n=1 Tax=Arachis hypogaea TaxID=3818 RepID=A0A444WY26_ARAHY|nr:hypothetical protein Ahy_B10g100949 isoform D [Arachis hypogaea]